MVLHSFGADIAGGQRGTCKYVDSISLAQGS